METRIEGRDGWIEVTPPGVQVLAKGDAALRARLETALAEAGEDDPADVVTDELTIGGVRRTPDFVLLDGAAGRVLVRGAAVAQLSAADGSTRDVLAPARGPWAVVSPAALAQRRFPSTITPRCCGSEKASSSLVSRRS